MFVSLIKKDPWFIPWTSTNENEELSITIPGYPRLFNIAYFHAFIISPSIKVVKPSCRDHIKKLRSVCVYRYASEECNIITAGRGLGAVIIFHGCGYCKLFLYRR